MYADKMKIKLKFPGVSSNEDSDKKDKKFEKEPMEDEEDTESSGSSAEDHAKTAMHAIDEKNHAAFAEAIKRIMDCK